MTRKEYYDSSENQRIPSTIACIIDISVHTKKFWTVSVVVPAQMLTDFENIKEMQCMFKNINIQLNGFNSFITRGSCYPNFDASSLSVFDHIHYSSSETWETCVRGYFWGNLISQEHVRKIGGIDKIKKANFAVVEQWNDCVYIQITNDIMNYTIMDAAKVRNLLLPAFPPKEDKQFGLYETKEELCKAKNRGIEFFFLDEDMLL